MSQTPLVVVGGQPDAISRFAAALPAACNFAVLACCGDRGLATSLRSQSKLAVATGQHKQRIGAGHVYVLPAGKDVEVRNGELALTPATLPDVQLDRLLRSVAAELGSDAVAVLFDDDRADGVLGVKRIKEVGGLVFVERGARADTRRAVMASGAVDQVGTPEEIASQLARLTEPRRTALDEDRDTSDGTDTLRDILGFVHVRSGHDFSAYKRATLYRRVARRMQVCGTDRIADYHQRLRDHPGELAHLQRDFLVSVTNFFRDPETFDTLATEVIPRLFQDRLPEDQIRVWVAGCATGEEVYSLGILLLEHAGTLRDPPQIQLFATDIDDTALAEARLGRYPETIAVDVSAARLERFFVREPGCYRVKPELRELVLFSPHNLLRDPPFSRLDLVSCRNLLIYLNREAQNRALSVFHFGLRPDGHLVLGGSESADASAMFSVVDPKARIYSRRAVPGGLPDAYLAGPRWQPPALPAAAPVERTSTFGELHHRLVERYAPPSLLVDGELEIVHLSEHAGKFLAMSGGEPTRNVLQLIIPALRVELRTAIQAARLPGGSADARRVVVEHAGAQRSVELRVRAADLPELDPGALLILIDDREPAASDVISANPTTEPVVRQLEAELHHTREQLRTAIAQHEASQEQLEASNEELQVINEQLRSASEEIEASKQELQSLNHELNVLNDELKAKFDEFTHANNDVQNLMTSTDIAVVIVDRDLAIKRYTPRALDLFNLIPSDVGRPFAHVTHRLATDQLPELAHNVLQHLRDIERDVTTRDGHRYLLRVLPYRSLEDRIAGVVLTFVDVSDLREAIDARRRTEAALQASEARLRVALRGSPIVVISLDANLASTWGYVLDQELGAGVDAMQMIAPADAARFASAAREAIASNSSTRAEIELAIKGEVRAYEMRFEPMNGGVTAVGYDVTRNRNA